MAKTCGIRLGRRQFEIVALEGSAKKPRIVGSLSGEIPSDPEDPARAAARALKEALSRLSFKADETGLAVDAGMAAFRNVTLPFGDDTKIEQVLKYEVENQLPQWNIDEVVVDFHVLNTTGAESHLLVTAVPKDDLWGAIHVCEKGGLEPNEVELEATAAVNAAAAVGAFHADSAEILVHVGESSTSLVVVDGAKVRTMRALHVGALPPEEGGGDESEGEDAEDGEITEAPAAEPPGRRLEEVAARVRREVVRAVTATSTANPLRAILLCGHPLPALVGDVVQDVPVEALDPIPEDAGDIDGDRGVFAVAFGAALGRMGGGIVTPALRREELRYTGTFERLELPFAVVSLLLFALLFVQFAVTYKQTKQRGWDMETWLESSNNFMLGFPEKGVRGNMRNPPEDVEKYAREALASVVEGSSTKSVYNHLSTIRNKLQVHVKDLDRTLGRDGAFEKPQSALEAATHVLAVIDSLDDRIGRFSIRELTATYNHSARTGEDHCTVRFNMSFFAPDDTSATLHYENLINELLATPWCLKAPMQGIKAMDGGGGVYVDGTQVTVDMSKVERESRG